MNKTQFVDFLVTRKILNEDLTLHPGTIRRIECNDQLLENLQEMTHYLEYDAPLKARLQCILQDIRRQPKCRSCGKVLKMRLDGRYRFTFPTYCESTKCFADNRQVKIKRRKTNIKKYGAPTPRNANL